MLFRSLFLLMLNFVTVGLFFCLIVFNSSRFDTLSVCLGWILLKPPLSLLLLSYPLLCCCVWLLAGCSLGLVHLSLFLSILSPFFAWVIMPSTPPLPSNAGIPSTLFTSSQRHQQAARNQERNQRHIGSPE